MLSVNYFHVRESKDMDTINRTLVSWHLHTDVGTYGVQQYESFSSCAIFYLNFDKIQKSKAFWKPFTCIQCMLGHFKFNYFKLFKNYVYLNENRKLFVKWILSVIYYNLFLSFPSWSFVQLAQICCNVFWVYVYLNIFMTAVSFILCSCCEAVTSHRVKRSDVTGCLLLKDK